MILVAPVLLLAAMTNPGTLNVHVIVFRYHPFKGAGISQEVAEVRERDKKSIVKALKDAEISYSFVGGLGRGYELSIRLSDVGRWQVAVAELHKSQSLEYYTEWQSDKRGYGLLQLTVDPTRPPR